MVLISNFFYHRHLLITRPTESVALECYIIDACEKSTHIAVMVTWEEIEKKKKI